jgi:hypothetical protein
MKRENFVGLVESVREAGKILRGEIAPSREFRIEIPEPDKNSQGFALCIKTDDSALLIPLKIYQAKFSQGVVGVVDEEGEAAIYPAEFFVRIDIPSEIKIIMEKAQFEAV